MAPKHQGHTDFEINKTKAFNAFKEHIDKALLKVKVTGKVNTDDNQAIMREGSEYRKKYKGDK